MLSQTKRPRRRSKKAVDSVVSGEVRRANASVLARADAMLQNRRGFEAAELALTVLKRDSDNVAALEVLARALWQQNRFVELIPVTKRLIALDPYEPGYRMLQGASYQCMGMFGEATKAYASIPQDVPEHARSRMLVAELRDWQSTLVSSLLKEDAVFRAQFARDPEGACKARGFEFMAAQAALENWTPDPLPITSAVRPS